MDTTFGIYRINRYIMECKFICASDTSLADGELIDTLWNVNICADNASKKSNGN